MVQCLSAFRTFFKKRGQNIYLSGRKKENRDSYLSDDT